MFCPTCGKENSLDQKYCVSCGTNLYAVAHALTGREDDFFTKLDGGMDALLARYSEHVFRKSGRQRGSSVVRSWTILGQSILTALIDLLLFTLMSTLLPIRLILLVVSTPFRLLGERREKEDDRALPAAEYAPPGEGKRSLGAWLDEPGASVTEGTTTLFDTGKIRR